MANTGKYEYIRLENGILSVQRTNSIAKLLEEEFDSYVSMDISATIQKKTLRAAYSGC